ncbi:MAG: hemerythrin domain-containing protein [Planctomycetes bacterium]|jgi:hemerythrin-like domain-containing protein|nr:hemerythrin domain-containing protein [Planctomycetota bacterium]
MDPIADLVKEHGPIKLMLRVLDKVGERLGAGEALSKSNMKQAIVFIREFADKCHHRKEEALLFPAIKENKIPAETELVGRFLKEHISGRRFTQGMEEAILTSDTSQFLASARGYVKLLDQHIDRENQALFPLVKKSLSAVKLEKLAVGFEDVEKNIIGAKRHEELSGIIRQLKEIYL